MTRWRLPLLFILLAILFSACFTLKTERRDLGYGREARFNPWLAAGRLLERNGMRVRFAPAYHSLPPQARALVLATPLPYLDAGEQMQILNWVKQGGHLVVELQEDAPAAHDDETNLLLRELDVRLRKRHPEKKSNATPVKAEKLRPTRMDNEGSIQTGLNPYYFLQAGKHAPQWTVSDKYGAHAMRFAVGAGRITVLSDLMWMDNGKLAEGDHAALLWRVVDAQKHDEVWLIHGSERPSLLALILEQATPFLLALALATAVWLWGVSRRFGPLQSVATTAARKLSEHIEASGRYLLHHGGLAQLFNASRQRLLTQVQRRHPQWKQLPNAQLAACLAERARIESAAVLRLLEADAPNHLLQFAADLRLINRLRKAL